MNDEYYICTEDLGGVCLKGCIAIDTLNEYTEFHNNELYREYIIMKRNESTKWVKKRGIRFISDEKLKTHFKKIKKTKKTKLLYGF